MARNVIQWTTDAPTKPGSYFVFSENPSVVELIEDPVDGGLMSTSHVRVENYFKADWLGPFTPEHLTGGD